MKQGHTAGSVGFPKNGSASCFLSRQNDSSRLVRVRHPRVETQRSKPVSGKVMQCENSFLAFGLADSLQAGLLSFKTPLFQTYTNGCHGRDRLRPDRRPASGWGS